MTVRLDEVLQRIAWLHERPSLPAPSARAEFKSRLLPDDGHTMGEESRSVGEGFDVVLTAAQANAPWAFNRLYSALAPKVAGYLRLQGAAEPDDVTSEVFLGAFSAIGSFSGTEGQFRSWLFTIAHRRLTDERRGRSRRPQLSDVADVSEHAAVGAGVEDEVLQRVGEERVRALCERLVPDQRDVLLLRLIADLTVDQTAEALGKSPGAVKALQRRGLAALRREFSPEGVPL